MSINGYCFKCGSHYAYVGATQIECGEDPKCENYTKQQAEEVQRLFTEKTLAEETELDFDDDTDPYLPLPLFGDMSTD